MQSPMAKRNFQELSVLILESLKDQISGNRVLFVFIRVFRFRWLVLSPVDRGKVPSNKIGREKIEAFLRETEIKDCRWKIVQKIFSETFLYHFF